MTAAGEVQGRCTRRFGRFGVCDAVLQSRTDGQGAEEIYCPRCERLAQGICVDCPRPVDGTVGRARRCRRCRQRAATASMRRSHDRHRKAINARARARYQADPELRARSNASKRRWRLANPERVAEQKRRYALRHPEKVRVRARAYHETRRELEAAQQRARKAGVQPLRRCCACQKRRVTGRQKKCDGCKERQRLTARAVDRRRKVVA